MIASNDRMVVLQQKMKEFIAVENDRRQSSDKYKDSFCQCYDFAEQCAKDGLIEKPEDLLCTLVELVKGTDAALPLFAFALGFGIQSLESRNTTDSTPIGSPIIKDDLDCIQAEILEAILGRLPNHQGESENSPINTPYVVSASKPLRLNHYLSRFCRFFGDVLSQPFYRLSLALRGNR